MNNKDIDPPRLALLKEGLAASPVFGGVSPGGIEDICVRLSENGSLRIVSFRDGDNISSGGVSSPEQAGTASAEERCGALGIVLEGGMTVSRCEPDERAGSVVLNVLSKGGCFGVCSLFSRGLRMPPTVITSSGTSTAAFIGEEGFTELLTSDSGLCISYLRFLTGRICFLNDKLHAFSGSTVNERVAQALLSSARSGEDGTLYCESSMSELARRLNIGRASLYRALNLMSEKGMLTHSGKRIEILDPELLACCK